MRKTQPPTEIADEGDILIMTVKLASGKFESTIQIPLFASEDSKQQFVEAWLNLMQMGLKCSPTTRRP